MDAFVRKPVIEDAVGLGVQLSAWTGFTWNHFAVNTLIRLGLVSDALMSDEPLWQTPLSDGSTTDSTWHTESSPTMDG